MPREKCTDLINLILREVYTPIRCVWNKIRYIWRVINISTIYIGTIDISSVGYVGLLGLRCLTQALIGDKDMFGLIEIWRIHVYGWYFGIHPKFQQS